MLSNFKDTLDFKPFQKQLVKAGIFYYFSKTSPVISFLFNFDSSVVDLTVQTNELFSTQLLIRNFILCKPTLALSFDSG